MSAFPPGWGHRYDPTKLDPATLDQPSLAEKIENIIKLATAARRACVCGNLKGACELLDDLSEVLEND